MTDYRIVEWPASRWAVFACHGRVPEAIVEAKIYAFTQWLPMAGK